MIKFAWVDYHVMEQFSTAKEALKGLINSDIDVAIVDISMPDDHGLILLEI